LTKSILMFITPCGEYQFKKTFEKNKNSLTSLYICLFALF